MSMEPHTPQYSTRPATLAEALHVLKCRLSEHLSPAEQRDLDNAIHAICSCDCAGERTSSEKPSPTPRESELQRILDLIPDEPTADWPNANEAEMVMLPSELRVLKRAILTPSEKASGHSIPITMDMIMEAKRLEQNGMTTFPVAIKDILYANEIAAPQAGEGPYSSAIAAVHPEKPVDAATPRTDAAATLQVAPGLRKEIVDAEFARRLECENGELRREIDAKQAEIDRLMIEYCPDAMTPEQTEEWAQHQRPVEDAAAPPGDHPRVSAVMAGWEPLDVPPSERLQDLHALANTLARELAVAWRKHDEQHARAEAAESEAAALRTPSAITVCPECNLEIVKGEVTDCCIGTCPSLTSTKAPR